MNTAALPSSAELMAPLTDPALLDCFKAILGEWACTGYVTATDRVLGILADDFPGLTLKTVAKLLHDYVAAGGKIDQVRERRPEYVSHDYHYDFRIQILGRKRYIETILVDDNPKDPFLQIVNIHDA